MAGITPALTLCRRSLERQRYRTRSSIRSAFLSREIRTRIRMCFAAWREKQAAKLFSRRNSVRLFQTARISRKISVTNTQLDMFRKASVPADSGVSAWWLGWRAGILLCGHARVTSRLKRPWMMARLARGQPNESCDSKPRGSEDCALDAADLVCLFICTRGLLPVRHGRCLDVSEAGESGAETRFVRDTQYGACCAIGTTRLNRTPAGDGLADWQSRSRKAGHVRGPGGGHGCTDVT